MYKKEAKQTLQLNAKDTRKQKKVAKKLRNPVRK